MGARGLSGSRRGALSITSSRSEEIAVKVYRITHEIFEPSGSSPDVPIVVHIFQGKTKAEAGRYFEAHQRTDSFFRGAVRSGSWNGMALVTQSSEGWVEI